MDNIELNKKEKIRKKDRERKCIQRNNETPEERAVRLHKINLSNKKRRFCHQKIKNVQVQPFNMTV